MPVSSNGSVARVKNLRNLLTLNETGVVTVTPLHPPLN